MLYDERSEAFEAALTRAFRHTRDGKHVFKRKHFKRERFAFVIWPLEETSMEKKETRQSDLLSAVKTVCHQISVLLIFILKKLNLKSVI